MLSLEAPLVAVAWQMGLADLHGIKLLPAVCLALAAAVWWIYTADRTLDALRASSVTELDVRHRFYHRWRWWWILLLLPLSGAALAWLAFAAIPEGMLWQGMALGLLAVLYLAAYSARGMRWSHTLLLALAGFGALIWIGNMPGSRDFKLVVSLIVVAVLVAVYFRQSSDQRRTLLPKPLAASIIFALGCVLAVRFFAPWETGISARLEELLLTCLFCANITSIQADEAERRADVGELDRIRRLRRGCVFLGLLLVGLTLGTAVTGSTWQRLGGLAIGIGIGLVALESLHRNRQSFSEGAFRLWADLSTLLPLPVVLWLWR